MKTRIALPYRLDSTVDLTIRLEAPVPAAAFDELSILVRSFLDLAGLGAYVIGTLDPGDCVIEIVAERRTEDGIVWQIRAAGVDARCVQVLRNALVAFGRLCHPVTSLVAAAPDQGAGLIELPPLDLGILEQIYPPASRHLRFRLSLRPALDLRSGRRVEIAFAQPLGDDALNQVVDRLELWSQVSLAGYARTERELQSGECVIFDAIPDVMDDFTVEMPIMQFGAPEVAWNSLLNLCGRCSKDLQEVASVTID